MWRKYHDTFLEELARPRSLVIPRRLDVVTGTLAAPLITEMAQRARQKYPGVQVTVHAVENRFFGGNVSVAGLVTATDIIAQCKGKLQSRLLGVPEVMLQMKGTVSSTMDVTLRSWNRRSAAAWS